MLLCPIPRTRLLEFLPKGAEVAEIGVARGEFSADILKAAAPDVLHLIDLWRHQDRPDYNDGVNAADSEQEARYQGVLKRFENEIAGGKVRVYRDYSDRAADQFEGGQFGWIYVDAMHTADAVYRDLVAFHDTIREGGFIAGHDYTNHVQARDWHFGVIEGVNRFVAQFGYEFVALTIEAFPTYVLARDPQAAATAELKSRLILDVPYIVEIRDFPQGREFQHKSVPRGDRIWVYPSF